MPDRFDRRPRLIVMLKEPRAGRVKTRLAREIGSVPAAWWFRHQTASLLRRLRDRRWRLELAVTPDRAGQVSRIWPRDLRRLPQGEGDLGARMARLLRGDPVVGTRLPHSEPMSEPAFPPAQARWSVPVLLIGGDIPGIRASHIGDALVRLGSHDAVFGPAEDGGYWLIGLARHRPPPPGFLRRVRWSTRHALADSRATLPGFRIAQAATLRDVDTAADLIPPPRAAAKRH